MNANKKILVIVPILLIVAMTFISTIFVSTARADTSLNPTTIYCGYGVPQEKSGLQIGYIYLDLNTNIYYNFNGTAWNEFGQLPNQIIYNNETQITIIYTGYNGTNGIDGTNGKDGTNWLFGMIAPTAELGNEGDLYLNFATWNVYVKSYDGWQLLGCIKGEEGTNGTDGINGTNGIDGKDGQRGAMAFYEGIYEPTSDMTLMNGDSFFYKNGDVYVYFNGSWVYFTNFKGVDGEEGPIGMTGTIGEDEPLNWLWLSALALAISSIIMIIKHIRSTTL